MRLWRDLQPGAPEDQSTREQSRVSCFSAPLLRQRPLPRSLSEQTRRSRANFFWVLSNRRVRARKPEKLLNSSHRRQGDLWFSRIIAFEPENLKLLNSGPPAKDKRLSLIGLQQ